MRPNACSRRSAASAFSVGLAAMTIPTAHDAVVSAWVSPMSTQSSVRSSSRGLIRPRAAISSPPGDINRCCQRRKLSVESSFGDCSDEDERRSTSERYGLLSQQSILDKHASGLEGLKRACVSVLAGLLMMAGGRVETVLAATADVVTSVAPTASVTVQDLQRYNGFEDYAAKGQQMENSDVSCFANECKRETASCFTDGSCLKGLTCLGRCKGEQECATRCFAQYGSPKLDSWLTCTLEDHGCVKIPKDMDFSAIDKDPPHIVKDFDAKMLQGTWFKVLGVNKKYDCFDCQKNSFSVAQVGAKAAEATDAAGDVGGGGGGGQFADIKVDFRLAKPNSNDFWENTITERLEIDPADSPRTFHTDGKLFGLSFKENWYVTGHSIDPGAEFVFVQYRGHTLQGSYEGGFVYSRKPFLSASAKPRVAKVAREHGIDPDALIPIDNTCSLRSSLPKAGDTKSMGIMERLKYEASFVYDLMEWVHPGTIHKYAKADARQRTQTTLERASSKAAAPVAKTTTAVAKAGGVSSSPNAGPARGPLDGNGG